MIELDHITRFYGNKTAERSGVPLINHIHEGLAVMRHIGASDFAQRAFVMHPLFQADADLVTHFKRFYPGVPSVVLVLAIEYRSQANAWLSDKVVDCSTYNSNGRKVIEEFMMTGTPKTGPLREVRDMLIADKVQNYKDFLTYHATSHPRRRELDLYFQTWLKELGVGGTFRDELFAVIDHDRQIRFVQLP